MDVIKSDTAGLKTLLQQWVHTVGQMNMLPLYES